MTGACHHLRPAAVFYDDRPKAQKAVLSIAGAKIRRFLVSNKFRHVIRSDFQQTYDLKVSLKNQTLCFVGRISMFCGIENYVFPYKSAYYKVITVLGKRIQYSVIQFFSPLLPFSV